MAAAIASISYGLARARLASTIAFISSGKTLTGCTVHMVTEEVDGGAIIIQKACTVEPTDNPQTLKEKVQKLEGEALVECIAMFKENAVGNQIYYYI